MEGLDETYEQAIKRIEGQEEGYRELAKRVLAWVTHAKRALYTTQVQHALAVNVGMAELDEDFLPEVEILGSICARLVTIDKKSDVIQLVHYTMQEYFERTYSFPNAEIDITATCVTYCQPRSSRDSSYCYSTIRTHHDHRLGRHIGDAITVFVNAFVIAFVTAFVIAFVIASKSRAGRASYRSTI
jgi:hypothetical protein